VVVICLAGPSISSSKNINVYTRGSLEEFGEFGLTLKVSDNVRPGFFAKFTESEYYKKYFNYLTDLNGLKKLL